MFDREEAIRTVREVSAACLAGGRRQLTEWETYQILRQWQIPVAPYRVIASLDEAGGAALEFKDQVAVKIVSPDIGHKTEAGCVRLSVSGSGPVAAACAEVLANARTFDPAARIHGVMIQQMAPPGVELIIGGVRDPSFGPVIMAGIGGIFSEVVSDVAFRLAPITESQAHEMLRDLKGYPLLTGARGRPRVDLQALLQAIVMISRLVETWHELAELDLNPLIAWGGGVMAVDGLATLRDE